ncbi:class I adenylate-forming enzyme family protein [Williamsia sp. D3]|uniref:class I adenylate-forming enzyme family protein n=1 Tax=Williamsia sp. D3 TaxID=1313067 RepID=UPI0003D2F271|nr:AMP-binding protein [Williamsia sp. D3]ETD31363.1 AMP-dependent acyl-CoA synthetase [Williamsia sp. D3]
MSGTVIDALSYWARAVPEQVAIDFAGDELTYRELSSWVEGVAHDLTARGVRAGDRVGLLAANSLEWCVAALGAMKVGAIVAPFNHRFLARELTALVDSCDPVVIYCEAALRSRLDEVRTVRDTFAISELEQDVRPLRSANGAVSPTPMVELSDPTAIVFTSGTTGDPKGVIFTHATIAGMMHQWAMQEPIEQNGLRPLMAIPLFTAGGIIWGIARTVLHGGTLLLQPGFDPVAALRVLVDSRATTFTGPPILWEQISRVPGFGEADLSHLTTAHVGGARVSPALVGTWLARGVQLRQLYGQTEIGGSATVMPRDEAAAHPDKCGWGGIFTKIRVVNADGEDCAPDEPGEILLRGPGMMPGYWRNDEATRAALVDGWLRTGDLGKLDERGYLTFVDRLKDMIISGGLNISPAEIEHVISLLPGVEEVAVISVDDDKFGETPAVIIRRVDGLTEADVVKHCNKNLADYKVPRYVVFTDGPLPRMASGKISKPSLRQTYSDVPQTYSKVR